jgi:predicted ATPase
VLAGSFTLDAAEAVAPAAGPGLDVVDVVDLLDSLVTKSMVTVVEDADGAAGRYRLLETMRAFVARELARVEEAGAARNAHLAHYRGLLRAAERDLAGINPSVLARFTVDQHSVGVGVGPMVRAARPGRTR